MGKWGGLEFVGREGKQNVLWEVGAVCVDEGGWLVLVSGRVSQGDSGQCKSKCEGDSDCTQGTRERTAKGTSTENRTFKGLLQSYLCTIYTHYPLRSCSSEKLPSALQSGGSKFYAGLPQANEDTRDFF